MKTLIKNMTSEQLQKVITDNENLQNEVLEILQENESFYIQEILNAFSLSNYNIDLYGYSFIEERDLFSFSNSVLKVQKDYEIFGEDRDNYVKRLENLLNAYDESEENEDETTVIYNRLVELVSEIKEYITEYLKNSYAFSESDIINNFIEFYYENFENYYIKNNDYTKLYIMTEKTI